jgi:hypothetical protein
MHRGHILAADAYQKQHHAQGERDDVHQHQRPTVPGQLLLLTHAVLIIILQAAGSSGRSKNIPLSVGAVGQ